MDLDRSLLGDFDPGALGEVDFLGPLSFLSVEQPELETLLEELELGLLLHFLSLLSSLLPLSLPWERNFALRGVPCWERRGPVF